MLTRSQVIVSISLSILLFYLSVQLVSAQDPKENDIVPVVLLKTPRPNYTDAAGQHNVKGTVILRVEVLATGQVGNVELVGVKKAKNLQKFQKYGLIDNAMTAARRIQFTPATRNGQAITILRQVEYTFS